MAKSPKEVAKKYDLRMASDLEAMEFVPTGLGDLDKLTGGFPRQRITELYGLQGVGKTTLTLMSIAAATQAGMKTLFIDCENGFNPVRAQELGVDTSKLAIVNNSLLEEVSDILMGELKNFDLIIIDSVAAMVPRAEIEGEAGDANVGLKARLMGQLIRKANNELSNTKCALVFINQLRESMEMFAPKFSTTGGNALRFFSSLRIELITTAKDRIEKTKGGVKSRVGHTVTARIIKSRVSKPYTAVSFDVIY
jgi:recombination protein RecA